MTNLLVAWLLTVIAPSGDVGEALVSRYRCTLTGLCEPRAVVITERGEILVADAGHHRIVVFDADGALLLTLGGPGGGRGELRNPSGVAELPSGEILVADTGNDRLQVFSREGKSRVMGGPGAGAGCFRGPAAIRVTGDWIHVADPGNGRIQILDLDLRPRGVVGGETIAVTAPSDLAVGPAGQLAIPDPDLDRVVVIRGERVSFLGEYGEAPGFLSRPEGVAFLGERLFVADTENHRIQVFDADGSLQGSYGLHALRPHEGGGKLHYPERVALSADGRLMVVAEPFEDRCQVFDLVPGTEPASDDPFRSTLRAQAHYGPRIDARGGLLALVEPEGHSVLIHDLRDETPIVVTRIGHRGTGWGGLLAPSDVRLDPRHSRIWVTDAGSNRLLLFALDRDPEEPLRYAPRMARFIKGCDLDDRRPRLAGLDVARPVVPLGLELDAEGNLYVLDGANARVHVLDPSFRFLRSMGGEPERARLEDPIDLAFGPGGELLYVADRKKEAIVVFTRGGDHHATLPLPAAAKVVSLASLLVLADGSMVIVDGGGHAVHRLDGRGALLWSSGEKGILWGQLFKPRGVALDPWGRLHVVDYGNHRVQMLSVEGHFLGLYGSRFFTQPALDTLKKKEES